MNNLQSAAQRKFHPLFFCCSILVGSILASCMAGFVLLAVFAPSIYNTLSFYRFAFRANSYYAQGSYQEAVDDYTQAINLRADDPFIFAYRGGAYAHLEDYENFKADMEMAISLAPNLEMAHNNLCWYGSLLGHPEDVMEACEYAVALDPDSASYRDSRGLALALVGDYEGAILDFQYYVDQAAAADSYIDLADARKRMEWIASLKQGIDPFDLQELQELLEDEQADPIPESST